MAKGANFFNVSHISKARHTGDFAGDHARYITRGSTATEIVTQIPEGYSRDAAGVEAWMRDAQATSRSNANIATRMIVTFPAGELTHAQIVDAVRDVIATVTEGRAQAAAAIHDAGADKSHPHAHIIFRDAPLRAGDFVAGSRTKALGWFNKPGSFQRFRVAAGDAINRALEKAGSWERVQALRDRDGRMEWPNERKGPTIDQRRSWYLKTRSEKRGTIEVRAQMRAEKRAEREAREGKIAVSQIDARVAALVDETLARYDARTAEAEEWFSDRNEFVKTDGERFAEMRETRSRRAKERAARAPGRRTRSSSTRSNRVRLS